RQRRRRRPGQSRPANSRRACDPRRPPRARRPARRRHHGPGAQRSGGPCPRRPAAPGTGVLAGQPPPASTQGRLDPTRRCGAPPRAADDPFGAAMSAETGATSIHADSPLARRNPAVKLGLLTAVSLVAVFLLDPVTPAALYVLALAAVAASVRAPARTLALAHIPFALFAVGILVVNVLTRPGTVLWQAGPLRVTAEGLEIGAALAIRTLLIGVLAVGFLLSTDGVALMTSLHQNVRLGPRLTYAVLAGYRMLQEMPREWA